MFLIRYNLNLFYTNFLKNLFFFYINNLLYIYIYFKFNFIYIYGNKYIFNYLNSMYLLVSLYKFFSNIQKLDLYQYEFFLDGLYYRIKYYKKFHYLGFIIGYNSYIFYKLPKIIFCIVHKKRRRFFSYSYNIQLLSQIMIELVNLKYPNLFKGKGIKFYAKIYRKKVIKEKK